MSRSAQTAIALVWILALAVIAVDAHRAVVNRPWWSGLIVYVAIAGVVATFVASVSEKTIQRRRRRH